MKIILLVLFVFVGVNCVSGEKDYRETILTNFNLDQKYQFEEKEKIIRAVLFTKWLNAPHGSISFHRNMTFEILDAEFGNASGVFQFYNKGLRLQYKKSKKWHELEVENIVLNYYQEGKEVTYYFRINFKENTELKHWIGTLEINWKQQ